MRRATTLKNSSPTDIPDSNESSPLSSFSLRKQQWKDSISNLVSKLNSIHHPRVNYSLGVKEWGKYITTEGTKNENCKQLCGWLHPTFSRYVKYKYLPTQLTRLRESLQWPVLPTQLAIPYTIKRHTHYSCSHYDYAAWLPVTQTHHY